MMSEAKTPAIATSAVTYTNLDIINARLPGYKGLQQICIDRQGIIQEILPMGVATQRLLPTDLAIDVAGDWISLGGVDLQINGALGLAFPDLGPESYDKLLAICQFLWQQGVDGFLPTLVTTSVQNIQRSLSTLADFMARSQQSEQPAAQILGIHLEGPFLNFEKRGAHPAAYLLPLTIQNVKQVLGDYAHIVKIITLAPELDETEEVIPYLRSLGITVSLGHSMATSSQAERAFDLGASMVTHAFNAMPGLHHREPGLLGTAIIRPDVWCGLIADGQHVCPTISDLLLRASFYEKGVFLVSDALAPLGLPDGVYPWDSRQIEVKNGTAWVRVDYHTPLHLLSTLAGTTLPLLVGAQNLVKWGICEVESAIAIATVAPRRAIGIPYVFTSQPANLLRWHLDESTKELSWQRLQK